MIVIWQCSELGFGANTEAALITRGPAEMTMLGGQRRCRCRRRGSRSVLHDGKTGRRAVADLMATRPPVEAGTFGPAKAGWTSSLRRNVLVGSVQRIRSNAVSRGIQADYRSGVASL